MNLNNIPYLDLNYDLDLNLLKQECDLIIKYWETKDYESSYILARKKYRNAWSGISLYSDGGLLYNGFTEGEYSSNIKPTPLKEVAPYIYSVIDKVYNGSPKNRVRLMRIRPGKSLLWHSHVQEHGQPETDLTIQIPINLPKGFKYCVVDKDEFRWYKRLYPPSWFKSSQCFELEEGRVYYFNSYHYHNVYNNSNEWRDTLMFYIDLENPNIYKHIQGVINE